MCSPQDLCGLNEKQDSNKCKSAISFKNQESDSSYKSCRKDKCFHCDRNVDGTSVLNSLLRAVVWTSIKLVSCPRGMQHSKNYFNAWDRKETAMTTTDLRHVILGLRRLYPKVSRECLAMSPADLLIVLNQHQFCRLIISSRFYKVFQNLPAFQCPSSQSFTLQVVFGERILTWRFSACLPGFLDSASTLLFTRC